MRPFFYLKSCVAVRIGKAAALCAFCAVAPFPAGVIP